MVRFINLLLTIALASVPATAALGKSNCTPLQSSRGVCAFSSGPGIEIQAGKTERTAGTSSAVLVGRGREGDSVRRKSSHCDVLCEYLKTHPDDPSLHLALRPTPGSAVVTLPPGPASATPAVAATRTPPRVVTAQDVARFLAAAGELHAEPHGWAVVGVPANYWIDVRPRTVQGSLLGEAAQVRFTPLAYAWDYGDGSGRTTTTGGSSWQALGQEELTATPTSHVFRTRGLRTVRVTVGFAAEYRLGGQGWSAVAGEVTASTPAVPVRVVVERTLLTATG